MTGHRRLGRRPAAIRGAVPARFLRDGDTFTWQGSDFVADGSAISHDGVATVPLNADGDNDWIDLPGSAWVPINPEPVQPTKKGVSTMDLRTSMKQVAARQRIVRGPEVTTQDVVRGLRRDSNYYDTAHDLPDPELRNAYMDVFAATNAATDENLERVAAEEAGTPVPDAPVMDLRTAMKLVTADTHENYGEATMSVADAVTQVRTELTQNDVDGVVDDRQLRAAYAAVMGAGRGDIDRELRRLPAWETTREERERSREVEQAHRQRVMENDVLAREEQLSPEDHSPEAEQVREVAGSIRDHREMAEQRAQWQAQDAASPAERDAAKTQPRAQPPSTHASEFDQFSGELGEEVDHTVDADITGGSDVLTEADTAREAECVDAEHSCDQALREANAAVRRVADAEDGADGERRHTAEVTRWCAEDRAAEATSREEGVDR